MSLDALLASTRSGDPRAREALADALYASLRSYFRRRCHYSVLEVEDLVQATLVVILHRIDSFVPDHPRAFEHLVFSVAGTILHTKRRSLARELGRRVLEPPIAVATGTSPSAGALRREALELVVGVVAELDSVDQRAIGAWLGQVDWQELAEREGVARSTSRSRLRRALARVRARMRLASPALFPELATPGTS